MVSCRVAYPEQHYRGKLDPDPHQSEKLDPDPHQSKKLDPDPHQSEKLDPYPHQSEKLDPDPHVDAHKWRRGERVCRPVVAYSHHFDEEQDSIWINKVKSRI